MPQQCLHPSIHEPGIVLATHFVVAACRRKISASIPRIQGNGPSNAAVQLEESEGVEWELVATVDVKEFVSAILNSWISDARLELLGCQVDIILCVVP